MQCFGIITITNNKMSNIQYLIILDYKLGIAEITVYDGDPNLIEDYIEETLGIGTSNISWMLTDSVELTL